MSFFDSLGKKITDTTHTVVEKTKSSTDTIRLNGQVNDEERNINAAYLNIGKKYVELYTENAEPEFAEYLQVIAESQQKIAMYQEQIRKNKHLLICTSCGAEISEAVLFCTKCGAENPVGKQLAEERAAKEAAERAAREAAAAQQAAAAQAAAYQTAPPTAAANGAECCQACGKIRTPGAMFCTGCGARFVTAQAPEAAPIPAPVVETPVAPIPTPVVETPVAPISTPVVEMPVAPIPTPVVETPVAPISTPVVETPVAPIPTPVAETPVAPIPTPVVETPVFAERSCPNCGKSVPEQNRFCTNCGAKVAE